VGGNEQDIQELDRSEDFLLYLNILIVCCFIKLSLQTAKNLPLSRKDILSMMKFWYQTVFDLMHREFYVLGQKGQYETFYMSGEGTLFPLTYWIHCVDEVTRV